MCNKWTASRDTWGCVVRQFYWQTAETKKSETLKKIGTTKADTKKSEPVHARILMGVIVPVGISRVDGQPFEC